MDRSTDQIAEFSPKKLPQFIAAGVGNKSIMQLSELSFTYIYVTVSNFAAQTLNIATLGALGLGTVAGYTSPALPDIKNSTAFSHLQDSDHSWIGSIAPVK